MPLTIKRYVLLFALLITANSTWSQATKSNLLLTADSLATGNYKDVFKSFFQLAFNRFIGKDKELQFSANPFAVMAKMNPELLIDTEYIRHRHLRNLNFTFGARLRSDYQFNGFSSGVKYALVNARDETVSRAFVSNALRNDSPRSVLQSRLDQYASTITEDTARRRLLRRQITDLFNSNMEIGKADTALQRITKEWVQELNLTYNPKLNFQRLSQNNYDSLKKLFQNRPLWTIGISDTTSSEQFYFTNLVLSTDFVKGIINPARAANIELVTRAALDLLNDSLKSGRNLHRRIFSFEPGLNFILKVKGTDKSFLEYKLSGSYYHTFTRLYAGEIRNRLTLNSTLRVRVFNDVWVPLEIKYDPATGNVFGFLNVRFNFNGIAKAAGGKSS